MPVVNSSPRRPHVSQVQKGLTPHARIRNVIAVGSGKGGVGKSTTSVNLAVALQQLGARVGVLDADIYGPSVPAMLGLSGRPESPDNKSIEPLRAFGVDTMSIGYLIEEDTPMIWRGPMATSAMTQLFNDTLWDDLDFLLIDLPPGTGDVQLSLGQKSDLTGAIVVSTPQDVALIDAKKALDAFATLKVPVLGLIENMSTFHCPNCGHEAHIFGHGGVAAEASRLGLPVLADLPIDLDTRLAGDAGTPVALGEGPMAQAYATLARRMIDTGVV